MPTVSQIFYKNITHNLCVIFVFHSRDSLISSILLKTFKNYAEVYQTEMTERLFRNHKISNIAHYLDFKQFRLF